MEIRARNTFETEVKEINQLHFLSNNTKQRRVVPGMFSVLGKERELGNVRTQTVRSKNGVCFFSFYGIHKHKCYLKELIIKTEVA